MVNRSLDATFAALANSTRREMLSRLAHGDATVSELAAPFSMSLPAVMKHLDVLESAGLVQRRKEGRVQHCRLAARPMKQAVDWMSDYRSFWEAQLSSLDHYLQTSKGRKKSP